MTAVARLIFHAGLPKTGTTAVQAFAARHREALKDRGFIYPTFEPISSKYMEAHHHLAHAVADSSHQLSLAEVSDLLASWNQAASFKDDTILLSAESVWRHIDSTIQVGWIAQRQAFLERLAEQLQDFEVKMVIVLRRQDTFTQSLFMEHVMKGTKLGTQSFAQFRLKERETTLRFWENLRLFSSVFSNVAVMTYDDLSKDKNLCHNFFKAIGVSTEGLEDVGVVRKSLSVEETLIKIYLNRFLKEKKQNKKLMAWLRSDTIKALAKQYLSDNEDLWESYAVRKAFLDSFSEENALICSKYFPDKKQLFPDLLPQETKKFRAKIPKELREEIDSSLFGNDAPVKF